MTGSATFECGGSNVSDYGRTVTLYVDWLPGGIQHRDELQGEKRTYVYLLCLRQT